MLPVGLEKCGSRATIPHGGSLQRYRWLGTALLGLFLASPLSAQLAPVGAPKGSFRFEIQGVFQSADQRLFEGRTEDYLADFGSPAFGSNRLPILKPADSLISAIVGPGFQLNLGGQSANGQLTIGTGIIGAALGLTNKITLFAHIPLVTTRVQAHIKTDSTTGNAGPNPILGNSTNQALADQFFDTFDNALADLESRIANGNYAGDPALDSLARSIAVRGTTVRNALFFLTRDPAEASPFVPTATSATGQQIISTVAGLQDTLANTLGVNGSSFTGTPVLPLNRVTDEDFNSFLADPTGPIQAFPLAEAKISRMGDMDVGAIYTVIDRFDRPRQRGGFRLAVTGLLRLPTGLRDNPNNLLDVGTGNGRYEVGVSGTADLGVGSWGTRLSGGYLLRLSTLRVRRVSSSSEPYADLATLTNVRQDVGDVVNLEARPFFRLARNFALHGLVNYSQIGADAVSYYRPTDAIPGVPASVLAEGKRSAVAVGGGVSYVGRGAHECEPGRRCGLPIEAAWNYSTVITGTGGRVVKFRTTQLEIRWYQRIWR
jgi:hypothetical protein